jgi:virulence-associated protein VagC
MKFAVLDTEPQKNWAGHENLIIEPFSRENDDWKSYKVYENEFPSLENDA